MNAKRAVVWATVAVIVVTMLASGPLVSSVDLTNQKGQDSLFCAPDGTLDLAVEQVPVESYAIVKQGLGTEQYSLEGDDVRLRVSNVTGCIVISSRLEIPGLGFSSVRHNYVTADSDELQRSSTVGGIFDSERITQESYDATLVIDVRAEENETVYRGNFTIPVEE